MIAIIQKLLNLGITEDMHFRLCSRVRIMNASGIIIILIAIFYSSFGFFNNYPIIGWLTVIEALCVVASMLLNYYNRPHAGFHLLFLSGFIFLCVISFVFGKDSMTFVFLLFVPVGVIIFFDHRTTMFLYSIISLLGLMAVMVLYHYAEPLYPKLKESALFAVLNFQFTGVLIFLGVKLFKTENIRFQDLINNQNLLLEEKNKDITSSIHYAKRIQSAMLTQVEVFKKHLPEHFILFRPKDIVSGDFYWCHPLPDGALLIGVGDCTGHGVPGAFMTLLSISFLNEITGERKITRPDLVLNETRKSIIHNLNPGGTIKEGRDGFDGSLLWLSPSRDKVIFAGANNPCLVLRNGTMSILEADRFPVGLHEGEPMPFTPHEMNLQKGDTFYLLTDGFQDQFGGEKGKKFKIKNLQQSLLGMADKNMKDQHFLLEKVFENWKGRLEQIDDVTVLGFRI